MKIGQIGVFSLIDLTDPQNIFYFLLCLTSLSKGYFSRYFPVKRYQASFLQSVREELMCFKENVEKTGIAKFEEDASISSSMFEKQESLC